MNVKYIYIFKDIAINVFMFLRIMCYVLEDLEIMFSMKKQTVIILCLVQCKNEEATEEVNKFKPSERRPF